MNCCSIKLQTLKSQSRVSTAIANIPQKRIASTELNDFFHSWIGRMERKRIGVVQKVGQGNGSEGGGGRLLHMI